MLDRLRRLPRPSAALLVAALALVVAATGTGYAAALARNSVGTPQLKANAVTSVKIKKDAVTGADVKESSLKRVPQAANAQRVGGTPLSGLLRADSCQQGTVKGLARINATAGTIPTEFGTAGVTEGSNCAGGTIEVRREGTGRYSVRFADNPATLALVQVHFDADGADEAACATVEQAAGGDPSGDFAVTTFDCSTDAVVNADFAIMLP